MRIAIAGIAHEALTFSPTPTLARDFDLYRGQDVLAVPGVRQAVDELGFEPVPLLVATTTTPGGPVEQASYLELRNEMLDRLRSAGPVDGICLVLHGALLVEHIGSGETDLVREVRALVGQDVLIAARFDLHAILTEEFASRADIWTGYRTAPHRDVAETFRRAASLLVKALRSGRRPRAAFIRLPLLLPGERATTDVDPMRSLLSLAGEIEQQAGILNAEVLVGFGWADAPHSGSSVTVIAQDLEALPAAREAAQRLATAMWRQRSEFQIPFETAPSVDEAIDRALRAAGTVFVTDTGDNPTAGATGDVPYFLSRLLERDVPDAVVAGLFDADGYRACATAGVGGTVTVSLGGKLDTEHGAPVTVTGVVEHLFRPEPDRRDVAVATLRVRGIRILIPEVRHVFTRLEHFRQAGIDPLAHRLVVVKLGYLFPELHDVAPREILALSPGCADMQLARLPFRYVQRPIYPLDRDFDWQPAVVNLAGWIEAVRKNRPAMPSSWP
jgi:microcystin degradation protein MlrC